MAYLLLDLVFQFLQAYRVREQGFARTPDRIIGGIPTLIAQR